MIHIGAHTLAIMLGLTFVLGSVFGTLGSMWLTRHKSAQLLRELQSLNARLDALKPTPDLKLVRNPER